MCLLVIASRVIPDFPVVVAANRDEWMSRPATAMTTLEPGIVGGRDERAGGTWAATNRHGLFAALTNVPPRNDGALPAVPVPDPARRSRGELPLILARHARVADAVEAFRTSVRAIDYNPCWIFCADRESLAFLDLSGRELGVTMLEPGLHVLENRALGAPSPKVDAVRAMLADLPSQSDSLVARLAAMLGSHQIPPAARDFPRGIPPRPLETEAPCVHAGPYGTRSAQIVLVGRDSIRVRFTPGPPCVTPWQETSLLQSVSAP